MSRFIISQSEYDRIRMTYAVTRDENIRRRLRALMMRYEGYSSDDIATAIRVNRSTVYLIFKRYRENGLDNFVKNNYFRKLQQPMTFTQEEEIMAGFEARAEAGERIFAEDIKQEIEEAMGRSVGVRYAQILLRKHGWRKVRLSPTDEEKAGRVFWIPAKMSTRGRNGE